MDRKINCVNSLLSCNYLVYFDIVEDKSRTIPNIISIAFVSFSALLHKVYFVFSFTKSPSTL
jgi:hypothetical protein